MSGSLLEGRVIAITGGGRGVGRAHALACAREGAAGILVNDLGCDLSGQGSDPSVADAVAEVRQWWSGPAALQVSIGGLLEHAGLLPAALRAPAEALREALADRQQRLAEIKAPWSARVDELQTLLDTARDKKQLNGSKLKKNNYDAWLQSLAGWRDDRGSVNPGLTEAATRRLTPDGMAEAWNGAAAPRHPALDAIAALAGQLAALPDARQELLCHAARWVAARFAAEQARRAQIGFNDLLTRLDAAP